MSTSTNAGSAAGAVGNAIQGVAKEFDGDYKRLAQDVGQLREDLALLRKDAKAAAKHGVQVAKDGLTDSYETAKEMGVQAGESAVEKMKEHPLATIAIAVGIGFLAGMLVGRPRSGT